MCSGKLVYYINGIRKAMQLLCDVTLTVTSYRYVSVTAIAEMNANYWLGLYIFDA
jgi:hypothetical protein